MIYGGSVDVDNAKSLINVNGVDGFLIGGASLDSKSFCNIIEIVSENYNRG
ncbi:MAG: triose-phosphate isomerase [Candidatus Neomarinimicrobiota bacterium]|nr:triose-phosphate isomerase [Candidatus Neomarinimicrobiota bacterium]